jgi:GTPase SAR1 family protein
MSTKMDEELSYATHKKHTMKFKIVFIGDQSVGKSSIINRFIKNEFDTTHNVHYWESSLQSE